VLLVELRAALVNVLTAAGITARTALSAAVAVSRVRPVKG